MKKQKSNDTLKTFKDFENDYNSELEGIDRKCFQDFLSTQWVHERLHLLKELKAEAVKWIISNKIKHMNGMDILLVFFNLTEEDLKETRE